MACIYAAESNNVLRFLLVVCLIYYSCCQPDRNEPDTDGILLEIFEGPLRNKNVHLIANEELYQTTNMEEILRKRSEEGLGSTMISSLEKIPETLNLMPVPYIRGSSLVVVMVLQFMPPYILDLLDGSVTWNPDYLLLISLNMSLDTSKIIQSKAIKRSLYIALVEKSKYGGSEVMFFVYTNIPFQSGKKDYGKKTFLGPWDAKTFAEPQKLFPERFKTFGGVTLYLSSLCDDFPFLYILPNTDVCQGTNLDILDIIAKKLNFSFVVELQPADPQWGFLENGTWTGIPAGIIYQGKDLMVNTYGLSEFACRDMDAIIPYYFASFAILVAKPPPDPKWRGLLHPFATSVWIAIICVILGITLLVYLVFLAIGKGERGRTIELSNVFLVVFGGLLQQPSVLENLRQRWATGWIGAWDLIGLIITTAYTGNLIAFLTTPYYPHRIETLQELADSNYRVAMEDYGPFLQSELEMHPNPVLRDVAKRFDFFPVVYQNYSVGFGWVLKGTHVITNGISYLLYMALMSHVLDKLYLMDEEFFSSYEAWYFPKNTPHKGPVDQLLQRIAETGQNKKLYDIRMDFIHKELIFGSVMDDSVQPFILEHFIGPFIILAIGIILALLSLLAELFVARMKTRNVGFP